MFELTLLGLRAVRGPDGRELASFGGTSEGPPAGYGVSDGPGISRRSLLHDRTQAPML